jgi:hypothetical protein
MSATESRLELILFKTMRVFCERLEISKTGIPSGFSGSGFVGSETSCPVAGCGTAVTCVCATRTPVYKNTNMKQLNQQNFNLRAILNKPPL